MSSSKYTRFFVFLRILQVGSTSVQNPSPPNLSYILNTSPELSVDTHPVIQTEMGDDYYVICEAPYPIQWKFEGYVFPTEVLLVHKPLRNLVTKMFYINLSLFRYRSFADGPEIGASIRISCHMTGHPEVGKSFTYFARGNMPNAFVIPKSVTVTDSGVISCPIKDPSLTPLLYRRNSSTGTVRPVQDPDLAYNPTSGFIYTSEKIFTGVYTCRANTSSVTITAHATPTFPTYEISPLSSSIRVYTDSSIKLQCLSKSPSQTIHLTFHNVSDYLNVSQSDISSGQVATVTYAPDPVSPLNQFDPRLTATAICWTGTKENFTVIHKWSLELVPKLTFVLDNTDSNAKCTSESGPDLMQILGCDNPMECSFLTRCLDNVTSCNLRSQRQFFRTRVHPCFSLPGSENCIQMPVFPISGLIQCSSRGLFRRWEFFTSLDYLRFTDWREAPKSELVRMGVVPSILYANESTQFTCMAVKYLSSKCYFELKLRNGSKILLDEEGHNLNISFDEPEKDNPRKIIRTVDIWLPLEAVGMTCLAPLWNSTEVLKTTRTFRTRHLQAPRLKNQPKIAHSKGYKRETFYIGQVSRRLACHMVGEPEVEYEWYFQETKAELKFPELKTSSGTNGESYLEFPVIEENSRKFTGEWTCIGVNGLGTAEQRIKLIVKDEPISGKTWAYIIIGIATLVALLVVIFVLVRRYRQAQALVRSLTDTEVSEFFNGKLELLTKNGTETGSSIVEFLPYKNEYEIATDDLEFDSSEKNVLGSGFFSYVVRGRIVSREKPVAVKISKPTADVTLFKSLLSEVKIMIYIGEHENIVTLIGVCTQDIKNRCIHIATDICDFGGLDGFLRKNRTSFVNLIDANQEIDCKPLANENGDSSSLSTLDLISFGQQIASGMEYLAFKSIIHADLAARNVLLTSEKICKISDFGLSKKLYESSNYVKKSQTPLPWRWMAIESLTSLTFSTSSDVWAYGVTLFEIFSLGDIPFPNETWNNEFLNRLNSGMRMGRPEYATQEIYAKVMACWERNPEIRPDFSTLRVYFRQLYLKFVDSYLDNSSNTYIANTGPSI